MFVKQVMAPSCTGSSEVEIQFEQRKYDTFFSQENIIWPNVVMRKAGNNQKKEWHILPYFQQSFTE